MLTNKDKRRLVLKIAGCAGLVAITGLAINSIREDWIRAHEESEDIIPELSDSYAEEEY